MSLYIDNTLLKYREARGRYSSEMGEKIFVEGTKISYAYWCEKNNITPADDTGKFNMQALMGFRDMAEAIVAMRRVKLG